MNQIDRLAHLAYDTNNKLINGFAERLVQLVAALPTFTTPGPNFVDLIPLADVIKAIRNEADQERYQQTTAVEPMLDLSTAHLSPAAKEWLERCSAQNHATNAYGAATGGPISTCGATMCGWFMHAPLDPYSVVPADLAAICVKARSLGCAYILFDADANELAGLPTWDDNGVRSPAIEVEDAGIADELAEPGELENELEALLADLSKKPVAEDDPFKELEKVFAQGFEQPPVAVSEARPLSEAKPHEVMINMAVINEVKAAARALMGAVSEEVEQRKESGIEDYWKPLDDMSTRLYQAIAKL